MTIGRNNCYSSVGKSISQHAEINAFEKTKYLVRSKKIKVATFDLIVMRITKKGTIGDSAPCRNCMIKLKKNKTIKIRNLYYSTNNGSMICQPFNTYDTLHISSGNLLIQTKRNS